VHDLLRQYAAEKLERISAACEAARDRHSAYYAAALQKWEADLTCARQLAALAEMDVEIDNARAAWDWAAERGQVGRLDQAMKGLGLFYEWRVRYQEGEAAFRLAAEKLAPVAVSVPSAASGKRRRVLARVLTWQSRFTRELGHADLAGQLLQQSLALLKEPVLDDQEPVLARPGSLSQDTRQEKAFVLLEMGHIAVNSDREQARRLYEQSLTLYQALGDRWETANVLEALGWTARNLGAYGRANQLYAEGLAIRRSLGDQRGVAHSLDRLLGTALHQGQLEQAEQLARETVAIYQEMGDRHSVARWLDNLGGLSFWSGRYEEACDLYRENLAICNDLGFHGNWGGLISAETMLGRYKEAREQGQRHLFLAQEAGVRRHIGLSFLLFGMVALAEEAYADAQRFLRQSITVYREIGQRDQMGEALASLGCAARGLGQLSQAQQHLYEALRTGAEIQAFGPLILALPAVALLLVDRGETERAVELYALASRHPFVANSPWFEDVAGRHIAAVAATLPPEVVAAAQERGRARDLDATMAELLAELEE
jgi:tetratricopeptide (TPR) repeat protein